MTRHEYVNISKTSIVIRPLPGRISNQVTHLLNGTINSSASILPEPSTSILSDPQTTNGLGRCFSPVYSTPFKPFKIASLRVMGKAHVSYSLKCEMEATSERLRKKK